MAVCDGFLELIASCGIFVGVHGYLHPYIAVKYLVAALVG